MNYKRTLEVTSPDYTENNSSKKHLPCQNMDENNQTTSQDVFTWKGFSDLFDTKLKDVARKSDLVAIQSDVKELKEENLRLNNEVKKLTSRLEYIDRRSRASNVVVAGLNCKNVQTAREKFTKLCCEVLKVNIDVVSTRMISSGKSFLFSLGSSSQAYNVVAAKANLKGHEVFIQKDYTEEEQNVRYNLRKLSKNITKANESVKVRLGEFCIYINNNKYTLSSGKVYADSANDAKYLKKLLLECNYVIDVCVKDRINIVDAKVKDVDVTNTL